jgi:LPXTG-motif cell wall-anchored protein
VQKIAAFAVLAVAAAVVPAVGGGSAAASPAKPTYTISPIVVKEKNFKGGEPGIAYDPKHNAVFYAAGTSVYRLSWDHTGKLTEPVDVTPPNAVTTLDTILVSNPDTGRVFVSFLLLATSQMMFTDDAGETWQTSSGGGAGSAVDHQSVGAGPLHAPLAGAPGTYPGSVYYCAQDAFNGQCSASVDGGVTFAPGVPVANTPANKPGHPFGGACSALHGHLRVGPDGTAYLPLKGCDGVPTLNNFTNSEFFGGRPSLSVSEDNGLTWQVRFGPDGTHNPDEADPSVAIGPQGTLYFGWQDGVNPTDAVGGDKSAAMVATSKDGGKTWDDPIDLSTPLGLNNVQFPEMIVGDDDRAAFSFIATPGIGNDQDNPFRGTWHLYVSTTYDAGKTWVTVDATPKDPINKGCVHMLGLAPGSQRTDTCDYRNMLDFNDITVDKDGRVLVAYTDACAADCSAADGVNADSENLAVVRQLCGKGLYAAGDAALAKTAGCAGGSVPSTPTGPKGPRPPDAKPPVAGPAHLPATGMPYGMTVIGLVLVGGALAVRRMRRRVAA